MNFLFLVVINYELKCYSHNIMFTNVKIISIVKNNISNIGYIGETLTVKKVIIKNVIK